ncbi:NAD(P)H-binding protein [Paraglaciecola hydrolytica]|uniref:Epimerase n=1 Tax=Paraglaciecola hydrolytica TaxID=1799789 RepID=A0A136A515_9ALTE|nr:NAD(P)H-binding protein [Paraglaciecola hydrolytica]KXI30304.1 epimerase [Paraglaciecola hydrolytica]
MSVKIHALVLGATGLVGKALVEQLLVDERYETITCLLRKPLSRQLFNNQQAKLQPIVIDFERLQEYQGYFGAQHIYVCLGTTIKQAGSRAAFRKVDFEYVHIAAQLARAQRALSFVWISSVGANAKSRSFYLRVKGELENAIMAMSGLPQSSAVRPSLLLGERKEQRFAETLAANIASFISPVFKGKLAKYRPVHAAEVAAQMIRLQQF